MSLELVESWDLGGRFVNLGLAWISDGVAEGQGFRDAGGSRGSEAFIAEVIHRGHAIECRRTLKKYKPHKINVLVLHKKKV